MNIKYVVSTLIFKDGKLLVGKRLAKSKIGQWQFPGGGIEDGESIVEAAVRETKEETGLILVNPLMAQIPPLRIRSSDKERLNVIYYVLSQAKGQITIPKNEKYKCAEWLWRFPEDIPKPKTQALIYAIRELDLI